MCVAVRVSGTTCFPRGSWGRGGDLWCSGRQNESTCKDPHLGSMSLIAAIPKGHLHGAGVAGQPPEG